MASIKIHELPTGIADLGHELPATNMAGQTVKVTIEQIATLANSLLLDGATAAYDTLQKLMDEIQANDVDIAAINSTLSNLNANFATSAQGALADTAVQPGDISFATDLQAQTKTEINKPINPANLASMVGVRYAEIATATADASSEISFTGLSDAYDAYMFVFEKVKLSADPVSLQMQVKNGSTVKAANYGYSTVHETNAYVLRNAGSSSIIILASAIGTSGPNESLSGHLIFYGPNTPTYRISSRLSGNHYDGYPQHWSCCGCDVTGTFTADGIRFFAGSGTIVSGTIKLYGVNYD